MSKSIYEEAIEILLDSFTDPQDEDDDCYMFDFRQMNKISKALKQAQKQEEVLYQIKEIIGRHDWKMMTESERYYEIKKLIKELEK